MPAVPEDSIIAVYSWMKGGLARSPFTLAEATVRAPWLQTSGVFAMEVEQIFEKFALGVEAAVIA